MKNKIEVARDMRVGAERLRQIAVNETDSERAAEMIRIAKEMDEHAAELERSLAGNANEAPNGATA
jgi:hypothetical protein